MSNQEINAVETSVSNIKEFILRDLEFDCDGMHFHLSPEGLIVERNFFQYHFKWDVLIPIGRLIYQRFQLNKRRLYDSSHLLVEIGAMYFRFYDNDVVAEVSDSGVSIQVREIDGEPDYTHWGIIPREVLQDRSLKSPMKRITTYMNQLRRQRRNARKENEPADHFELEMAA